MAEFQEVAKHWKRMCEVYWTPISCRGCPIAEQENAYEACSAPDINVGRMEELVMAWAAENPEPVYPTWYEYLSDYYRAAFGNLHVISKQPIPADLAQKLGIEPKEV